MCVDFKTPACFIPSQNITCQVCLAGGHKSATLAVSNDGIFYLCVILNKEDGLMGLTCSSWQQQHQLVLEKVFNLLDTSLG